MQHDMNIANQGFPAFRADLNNALGALVSNNSGATAPATTFAHQYWVDTSANPSILKIRNADNDAFITIGTINQTADTFTLTAAVSATTLNTSGQVVFNDAGANVDFRVEGDTEPNLLFVDASADAVGIGTNTPNVTGDGTAGRKFLSVIGTAQRGVLDIGSTSSAGASSGTVRFVNGSNSVAEIAANSASGSTTDGNLFFLTSNTERMRIDSAGNVGIANGNLKFTTNGTGIDFSASAGGGATSSLLDDYEEGTWTPVLGGSTSQSGQTYSRQQGRYTKIGRQVTVTWDVVVSNVGTMSGNAHLRNLPFSVASGSEGFRSGLAVGEVTGLASSVAIFAGLVVDGTTDLFMRTSAAAATGLSVPTATNLWGNGSQFIGSITYFTAT